MKKRLSVMGLAVLATALSLAVDIGATEVYRWVDKDGVVHYADSPPPAGAETRRLGDNRVEVDKLPFATREAMKKAPVTLYVSQECGESCVSGKQLLSRRKVPFTEKTVATAEDLKALQQVTGQKEARVPVLAVGGRVQVGFEAASWNGALDLVGYPK